MEIKHFSDYNLPNKALNDGDIDMNAFQHFAFLYQYKKAHKGTKISALSTTVLAPLGIYSDKIKDVKRLKMVLKLSFQMMYQTKHVHLNY